MEIKYNPRDFGKVVVLMGGASPERERSLASGKRVLEVLSQAGIDAHGLDVKENSLQQLLKLAPDRAFIALQGEGGEDGSIQGVLKYLDIPYTGSDVTASALTMNKSFTKLLWQSTGIPTPAFRLASTIEDAIEAMQHFALPICVKPVRESSSVGVTRVLESEQLPAAFYKAKLYDSVVMIEPWIEGPKYAICILGANPLPIVEIQTIREFDETNNASGEEFDRYICPSSLGEIREQALKALAFRAFQVTGCNGWGKVDVVEDDLGIYWFLGVNTVPSLSDQSDFTLAASQMGLSFNALVLTILAQTLDVSPPQPAIVPSSQVEP